MTFFSVLFKSEKPQSHIFKTFFFVFKKTTTDLSDKKQTVRSDEMNCKIDKGLSNMMVKNYNNVCH